MDDLCPVGRKGWYSNRYSDWDNDGCSDLDEDDNDDNDDHLDEFDMCAKGVANWVSDSASDWDNDGCQDATEDDDDDNDGVNDVNATGDILDLCPQTPINATDVNDVGCAAVERDTDNDGVNDLRRPDAKERRPVLTSTTWGAQTSTATVCLPTWTCVRIAPDRWSVDSTGCAVVQNPVPWTSMPAASTDPCRWFHNSPSQP